MNLLAGTVSLLAGIVIGIMAVATASALVPSILVNLGLHGTMLCVLATLFVAIPWLRGRVTPSSSRESSVFRMLLTAFVVGVAFRVIAELAFEIFGESSPARMTWGNAVVILDGKRTLDGWVLLARGCVESGVTCVVLNWAVVILFDLTRRVFGIRAR